MTLVDHLELHLGKILRGWSTDAAGAALPCQVVQLDDRSLPGVDVFCTLGLSRHRLSQGDPERPLAQELLVAVKGCGLLPVAWLTELAEDAVRTHQGYLNGQSVGPRDPLVAGSLLTGFFFYSPVYWPDELAIFSGTDQDVVISWAVPVTSDEHAFIASHGWPAFEDLLVAADPDLYDIGRANVDGIHPA